MANKNTIAVELIVNDNGTVTMKQFAQNAGQTFRSVESGAEAAGKATESLTSSALKLISVFVSFQTISNTIQKSIDYLATIETATLGIASAYMTGGKYLDSISGKALSAERALAAAQQDAKQTIEELKVANLQTIATLDQLVRAYQVTLPVALAKGFDRSQVQAFTVAMVQAAGAIGLEMNQLAEETRSLLTGNINPRDSRIAMVLGLRPEDIREHSKNATQLFNFLMDKLTAYRVAGIEAQNTWAGLWSNFKDILQQAMGMRLEPLFDVLKYEMKLFSDNIYAIDEKTRTIKWNPEFLEGINNFRKGLDTIIAQLYRIGMLADKFGGSISGMASMIPGNTEGVKRNAMYQEHYMKSEKALQDMSMRELGWKPMTPAMDKQMRDAALKGKKIAQQMMVNVGDPDNYTGQLLRYYKEIDQNTKWKPGTPTPTHGGKASKGAQREEEQILASLTKQNKTYYDTIVAEAKSAAELKIKQGENVLDANMELYAKEQKALDAWYDKQADIINETFDKESVKEQKLDALYLDYSKKWDTNKNEKQKKIEEYNQKHITVEADLYKTINRYSEESIAAEIAALEVKYLKDKGYTQNTTLLEEAKAEKIRQIYATRDKAQLDYYQKTGVYAQEAAETIRKLADDEYRQVLKATQDAEVAAKAKADYEIEAHLRMAEASDDFFKGIEAQYKKYLKDQERWGKAGADSMRNIASSMERGFSDTLFDALTGKFQSLGDYFNTFKESVLRNFTDMIGKMATQKVIAYFSTAWETGGTSVIDSLAKVMGYAGSAYSYLENLDLGEYFGVSFAQGGRVNYDDGGAVGGRARYPGDHPGNDTVPAWLSPGEIVIRRSAVNPDTEKILDYINRYGMIPADMYYGGGSVAGMVTNQAYRGYSGYNYYSMSQRERASSVDALLSMLGADMNRYRPGYVDPWDTSGTGDPWGSATRDKYQDILASFATDGGITARGWNTNIYNRWGLPDDFYKSFVIPYLQAEAPMGAWPYQTKQLVNDIGSEMGGIYDQNKRWMEMTRRSEKAAGWENTWMPYLGAAYIAAVTYGIGSALAAPAAAGAGATAGTAGAAIPAGVATTAISAIPDLVAAGLASEIPASLLAAPWWQAPLVYGSMGAVMGGAKGGTDWGGITKGALGGGLSAAMGSYIYNSLYPINPVLAAAAKSGIGALSSMGVNALYSSLGIHVGQAATGAMKPKISAEWGDTEWLFSLLSDLGGTVGREEAYSAANGLDYVPYDNFLIRAHKGERVQTAEEAKATKGGQGNSCVFNLYATVADMKTFRQFAKDIKQEIDKINKRVITVNA